MNTDTTDVSRRTGTVRWFDTTTGLGGITPDDVTILPAAPDSGYRHGEVVLHYSDIIADSADERLATAVSGARVTFEVFKTKRSTTALNVRREGGDGC